MRFKEPSQHHHNDVLAFAVLPELQRSTHRTLYTTYDAPDK